MYQGSPQGGYPPQQGGQHSGGYPPQQGGYPPQQQGGRGGYPPQQQGGYPPQSGYPPQQGGRGGYPPQQQGGYPPQSGYPPQGYPPQQGGYPPQQGGIPPPGGGGHPQQQGGYSQQGGSNWGNQYYSQIQQQEMLELQGWFSSVDQDGSGTISAVELAKADWGGKKFTFPTAQMLIKVFDSNKSGEIDFHEYAQLHKFIGTMQGYFYQYDQDNSNRLDKNELMSVLQSAGFVIRPETVDLLIQRYEKSNWRKTGALTFENFIQCCAFLGLMKSTFTQYDPQGTGVANLNLEQLVSIAAYI
eukprot:CAMPEP_0174261724 /NCGR_PEP_ID=MMETSP0439-20130205/11954_1 /TAXON_ID=0 /ORGANISM="Stereomyxa ramosa, Strain Chinc5" /LENGTH=299 /DNA_ID=CAMNT_0015346267 /DNA_START=21 /DNA_END=920 /DNA_ORIENTATION=+